MPRGGGIERDELTATHWLVSAISQGYEEARMALDQLFTDAAP